MKLLKLIFGIGLVVLVVYGGYLLLPAYMAAYEFEDAIKEEAKLSAYSTRGENEIRDSVLRKARELQIPITPEHITVKRDSGDLVIAADYSMHVDFVPYPFDLDFHPSSRMRRFVGLG